jgi:hypothetical protein
MSLLFFPRPLDEIAFGPVWSLVRVPPIANLCPPETPIYTHRKSGNASLSRLKVAHDTPPLRGFGLLVSRVFNFALFWTWRLES